MITLVFLGFCCVVYIPTLPLNTSVFTSPEALIFTTLTSGDLHISLSDPPHQTYQTVPFWI